MNKRGSIVDIGFIMVVAIITFLFILVVGYVFVQVDGAIKNTTPIGNNTASNAVLSNNNHIVANLDYIFIMIFVGLTIAVFISSFNISVSTIALPIYIIALAFLIIISAVGQYVYGKFAEVTEFQAQVTASPMMDYIMSHFIVASIGILMLSMILVFAKPGQRGPY